MFSNRYEQSEQRIHELEDRTIKSIQSEEQKEKKIKVTEPKEPADTIEHTKIHFMGLPEGKREKKEQKEYFLK